MIDGKFQKCAQLPHTSLHNELSTANNATVEAPLTARDELHGDRLEDQKPRFEIDKWNMIKESRRQGTILLIYCILIICINIVEYH